jgi:CAAX prenyl protease-like protein
MSESIDHGPRRPFFTTVVPMLVFLSGSLFEPVPSGGGVAGSLGIPYSAYPIVYSIRLAATLAALAAALGSLRGWLGRPAWWPPLVGLGLAFPWIVLAGLQREAGFGGSLGERSGFNPFEESGYGFWLASAFLAVRFAGLVVVTPIVEELFLRGFLMRAVVQEDFQKVPFGLLTFASAAACAVYAVVSHPAEAVAAVGWFSIVSGIAAATRRPIDPILAHAATNLVIGIYVVVTGAWWLM